MRDGGTHSTWEAQSVGRERMWSKRADRATAYFQMPGQALDIGAGFGDFLAELKLLGWDAVGTEVSEDAVRHAGRRGVEVLLGSLEDACLPGQSFDLVTMWHVLEHVPWPGRTLDECARLVRSGGMLIIGVPNDSLFPRLAGYFLAGRRPAIAALWGSRNPGEEIHLSFFSPRRLSHALERYRFATIEIGLDDHYPEPSVATARSLRRNYAFWVATGRRFSVHRTIYAAARR